MGQASSASRGGGGAPAPVPFGIERSSALMTSPMLRISLTSPVGGPFLQDRPDVAPVSLVVADRLGEGVFDPVERVVLGRLDQLVGDDRRQQADVLLVEPEDVGPLRDDRRGGFVLMPDRRGRRYDAARHFRQRLAVAGGVEQIPD